MNIRILTCVLGLASFLATAQTAIEGCWKVLHPNIDSSKSSIAMKELSFANASNYFIASYTKTNTDKSLSENLSLYNQDGRYYNIANYTNAPNFDTYTFVDRRFVYGTYDEFTISGRGTVRTINYKDYTNASVVFPSFSYLYTTTSTGARFIPHIESDYYNQNHYWAYLKGDSVIVNDDNSVRTAPLYFSKVTYPNFDFVVTDGATASLPSYHILSTAKDQSIEVNTLSSAGKLYSQSRTTLAIPNERFKIVNYQKGIVFVLAYISNTLNLYQVDMSTYTVRQIKMPTLKILSPSFDFKMLGTDELFIAHVKDGAVGILKYNVAKDAYSSYVDVNAKTTVSTHVAISLNSSAKLTLAYEASANNIAFRYFTEAPKLPKPAIDTLVVGFGGTSDLVTVRKGNTYYYCGQLFSEEGKTFDFANLSLGVDTLTLFDNTSNRAYVMDRAQYPTAFAANRFPFSTYSTGTYVLSYSNSCFKSDTLFFRVRGQGLTLTESPINNTYCQNATNTLSMVTPVVWTLGTYMDTSKALFDTVFVKNKTTTYKYPKSVINTSEIPLSAGVLGEAFTVYKTVKTSEGCSFKSNTYKFALYRSANPAILALNRAEGNKRLILPYDRLTNPVSDTLYYFAWAANTVSPKLRAQIDTTGKLKGIYTIGNTVGRFAQSPHVFSFVTDTGAASTTAKYRDLFLSNTDTLNTTCDVSKTYKFLLKKITFADLKLAIVGDSIIKPGNLYPYGVYSAGLANKLSGLDYRFKWKVFTETNLTTPVAKRYVELSDTMTIANVNKMLGKTNGKYVLQVDIYLQQVTGAQKLIGTLRKSVEVQTPAVVVTESGGTIDPNRLGSNLCKVDTFSCSGLYLKSIAFSNLSQNRGGCANTPTVDNTADTSKFVKVFTSESYQFALKVGNEYSTSGKDSASVVAMIDYDNDGVIGEVGEVFVSAYSPVSEVSILYSIPNLPENAGDKRMSIILSSNEINNTTDLCNLIADDGTVQEDFLIHIESPPNLLVTSFVTPNGDGRNDNFEVRGVDERYSTKLTIYNKFGAYVYEKEGVGLSTYKTDGFEKNLKPDTYYYLFVNGDNTSKGFFEVR